MVTNVPRPWLRAPLVNCGNARSCLHLIGAHRSTVFPQASHTRATYVTLMLTDLSATSCRTVSIGSLHAENTTISLKRQGLQFCLFYASTYCLQAVHQEELLVPLTQSMLLAIAPDMLEEIRRATLDRGSCPVASSGRYENN